MEKNKKVLIIFAIVAIMFTGLLFLYFNNIVTPHINRAEVATIHVNYSGHVKIICETKDIDKLVDVLNSVNMRATEDPGIFPLSGEARIALYNSDEQKIDSFFFYMNWVYWGGEISSYPFKGGAYYSVGWQSERIYDICRYLHRNN